MVLSVPASLRLVSQPLDAGEDRRPIRGECLTEPGRRIQVARHSFHDLRKESQSHEARLEVVLQGGILQLGAFQGWVALQELVERRHAGGIGRAQEHLRQELVRIEGDGSEQSVEGWLELAPDRAKRWTFAAAGRACTTTLGPNGQTDRCEDQSDADDEGELPHVSNRRSYRIRSRLRTTWRQPWRHWSRHLNPMV